MSFNYLLAGTVSTNPLLGLLAILLVLAWRIAGFLGLDHWLLPVLGTPWTGSLRRRRAEEVNPPPQDVAPVPTETPSADTTNEPVPVNVPEDRQEV